MDNLINTTKCRLWKKYYEMGIEGVKGVAGYKVFTARSILDLINIVAPKLKQTVS